MKIIGALIYYPLVLAYYLFFVTNSSIVHIACPQPLSNTSNDSVVVKLSSLARVLFSTEMQISHPVFSQINFLFKTCHQLEPKMERYYLDGFVYENILKYNESETVVKNSTVYFVYEIGEKIKKICPFSKYFILKIECNPNEKESYHVIASNENDKCSLVSHIRSQASCNFTNFNPHKVEEYLNENSKQIVVYPAFILVTTIFSFIISTSLAATFLSFNNEKFMYYVKKWGRAAVLETDENVDEASTDKEINTRAHVLNDADSKITTENLVKDESKNTESTKTSSEDMGVSQTICNSYGSVETQVQKSDKEKQQTQSNISEHTVKVEDNQDKDSSRCEKESLTSLNDEENINSLNSFHQESFEKKDINREEKDDKTSCEKNIKKEPQNQEIDEKEEARKADCNQKEQGNQNKDISKAQNNLSLSKINRLRQLHLKTFSKDNCNKNKRPRRPSLF